MRTFVMDHVEDELISINGSSDQLRIIVEYLHVMGQTESPRFIGIKGVQGEEGEPLSVTAVGTVEVSSKETPNWVKGTRLVAIGVSTAPTDAKELVVYPSVAFAVPDTVSAETAVLAGLVCSWVNMIKSVNAGLGASFRVGGRYAPLATQVLRLLGYCISEGDSADFYFPTDENSCGAARRQISWNNAPGADWNDAREIEKKVIFSSAYVHNRVCDNLQAFWAIARKLSCDALSPDELKVLHPAQPKAPSAQPETCQLPLKLAEFKKELAGRKKPATVLIMKGTHVRIGQEKEAFALTDSIIGLPGVGKELCEAGDYATVNYPDGSVATIRLVPHSTADHLEIHFDGKSIIADGESAKIYK